MKTMYLCLLAFALINLSCDQATVTIVPEKEVQLKSISNLTIETGMDMAQINSVISSASSGQTVWVEPGTYVINGKLKFKNGITLKNVSSTPVFDATGNTSRLLEMYYSSGFDNCVVDGIEFHNIRFRIADAVNVQFVNCIFDHGVRMAGTDKKYLKDAYVHFLRVEEGLIDACTFSRREGNSGRGVYNAKSTAVSITNNTFGDGGATGYFTTAINDNSAESYIANNQVHRIESWVNKAETDHGMYCHSFHALQIIGNTISGWPADASGGAIKARNGDELLIQDNVMNTSGILLYTYKHSTQPYLNNVIVENNFINVAGPANDLYHGIGYWRNTPDGSELSIRIANNELSNGTIKASFGSLVVGDFNAAGGGVFNNDISTMNLKSGINQSGNY
ncbi:hypothetical protein [Carboxylicivirga sp. N1Y90]|uniref:hypothetical protein n=1 Tax=Carboxylicivirga fragile TaxID=3417571 RepID=UPI003D34C6A1|nr:hypothetical protein [Marinilabiliaceae bacterium N1Y90]